MQNGERAASRRQEAATQTRVGILGLILLLSGSVVSLAQANAASIPPPPPPWMFVIAHAHPDTGPVSQEFLFDFVCMCLPTSAVFNFGDGTPPVTSLTHASHTYAAPGTYTATITVSGYRAMGDGFAQGMGSVVVTVQPDYFFVTVTATPNTGPAPLTVAFTTDTLGGKKPFTYAWDFGDGQTTTGENPTHAYGRTGTYSVKLLVTDSRGWQAGATTTVFVAMGIISISTAATPTSGYAPLGVYYSSAASGGTPPYTFSWRFSDGTTATGATANVTYAAPGTYTAMLTVSDSNGNWTVTGAPPVQVYPKMPMP